MAASCPNCGTCLCTGAVLTKSKDNKVCCSKCVVKKNQEIDLYLQSHPGLTLYDLKYLK